MWAGCSPIGNGSPPIRAVTDTGSIPVAGPPFTPSSHIYSCPIIGRRHQARAFEKNRVIKEQGQACAIALQRNGAGALLEKLGRITPKLEDVTDRIFQGLKTSADKIYIVEEKERKKDRVRIFSPEKQSEYWLEPDLLHPLIKGGDSKPYNLSRTNRLILFPYAKQADGETRLIPDDVFKSRYPLTWDYLKANKVYLEERENGKMRGLRWYAQRSGRVF